MFNIGAREVLTVIVIILDAIFIISILFSRSSVLYKIVWTLVILVLPVIGLIIYLIFARSPRVA